MKKGYIVILVIICLITILVKKNSYSSFHGEIMLGDTIRGDVNGDGVVNNLDMVAAKNHAMGVSKLKGDAFNRADLNSDGKIDFTDFASIKYIVMNASKTIKVTGVTLNKTTLTLDKGNNATLTATISPSNATNKTVTWSSSNEKVVKVDSNGKVTAVAKGTATITVTTKDGSKKATCKVTVNENVSTYDITENIPEGFTVWKSKIYSSKTLKYKVLTETGKSNLRYAVIWVKDAVAQLNCGNSNFSKKQNRTHFNNEIKSMGYASKGMIGTNGGFAMNGRDNIPILATKGVLTKNDNYVTWTKIDGQPRNAKYGIIVLTGDGLLQQITINQKYIENPGIYTGTSTEKYSDAGFNAMKQAMINHGVRNAWAISGYTTNNWQDGGVADVRTTICQIDKNNFVLATGYVSGISTFHKYLHEKFGCVTVANLDGGGSSGMFYKTNTMNSIGDVYQYKRPSESDYRSTVDILYFVE